MKIPPLPLVGSMMHSMSSGYLSVIEESMYKLLFHLALMAILSYKIETVNKFYMQSKDIGTFYSIYGKT
jgi:hypothetical protein